MVHAMAQSQHSQWSIFCENLRKPSLSIVTFRELLAPGELRGVRQNQVTHSQVVVVVTTLDMRIPTDKM